MPTTVGFWLELLILLFEYMIGVEATNFADLFWELSLDTFDGFNWAGDESFAGGCVSFNDNSVFISNAWVNNWFGWLDCLHAKNEELLIDESLQADGDLIIFVVLGWVRRDIFEVADVIPFTANVGFDSWKL